MKTNERLSTGSEAEVIDHTRKAIEALGGEYSSEAQGFFDSQVGNLYELLQGEGVDEKQADFLLEETANSILDRFSSEYHRNIEIVRDRRVGREDRLTASRRQEDLFALARQDILAAIGMQGDSYNRDYLQKENIRKILSEASERDGSSFNPLRALGFIVENEDGQDVFRFPEEIMTSEIDAMWKKYISSVQEHLRASSGLSSGHSTPEKLIETDNKRRVAHDSLAVALQALLGMDDFDELRSMVTKMREGAFPGVKTGEEARLARKLTEGLTVTDALRESLLSRADLS